MDSFKTGCHGLPEEYGLWDFGPIKEWASRLYLSGTLGHYNGDQVGRREIGLRVCKRGDLVKRSKPIIYAAAALLALSLQASAGGQESSVEFDGGVDIRGILQGAKENADAEVLKPENFQAAYSRWERDCATVSMGAQDPTTSERITLESRFYQERCYPSGPTESAPAMTSGRIPNGARFGFD